MKIAITGKGGVGKTTLAGTLAVILSQKYRVYAIDADPDMNLAGSLGIHQSITPIAKMKDLIKDRTGAEPGSSFGEVFKMNPTISDLPESLSTNYDDEGRLKILVMGTVDKGGDGCVCPASVMLKAILKNLIIKKDEMVILDMEAGIEHLGRRTAEAVDVMIIVTEPGLKSLETASRIQKLATDIGIKNVVAVINKVSSENEEKFVAKKLKELEVDVIGSIPRDDAVIQADMDGRPLTDYPQSRAFKSIEEIAENILNVSPSTN
ncbi:MAG: dehydrogenase maturation factor [Methanobacterium sp.]|jgi:CO dehydrogenase maturation factor|uniref:ATP-binding protein n=1 Tax=Methanobacterium sp. TaxID=2164 RepID=UPI0003C96119|nr:AAA family ATPase [Methanobacterium sp.]MDI3549669.1 dehydrogenase maturation factor [Methanobacterium sp.]CDG65741.1 putative ATP-binding protein MJ0823 [Methanobacterium sp. MB1]